MLKYAFRPTQKNPHNVQGLNIQIVLLADEWLPKMCLKLGKYHLTGHYHYSNPGLCNFFPGLYSFLIFNPFSLFIHSL